MLGRHACGTLTVRLRIDPLPPSLFDDVLVRGDMSRVLISAELDEEAHDILLVIREPRAREHAAQSGNNSGGPRTSVRSHLLGPQLSTPFIRQVQDCLSWRGSRGRAPCLKDTATMPA